jgi:hypothetical protein
MYEMRSYGLDEVCERTRRASKVVQQWLIVQSNLHGKTRRIPHIRRNPRRYLIYRIFASRGVRKRCDDGVPTQSNQISLLLHF